MSSDPQQEGVVVEAGGGQYRGGMVTKFSLEFSNLEYSVREGPVWSRKRGFKRLLKGVSGKFRSGELTAVMGPSGAGKSTLLNVLGGYMTRHVSSGEVCLNGSARDAHKFRKLSCYIMQDSALLPNLSVLESMYVAAALKLGDGVSKQQRHEIVNSVLEELDLKKCSNTFASNLSGGQRKRLSIAQEMVSNPPIMFFDEPTTGLDSSVSLHLVSLLKSLARGGRLIVCSIHQPSGRIFEMFDQVYLMTTGQCIYRGDVKSVIPYLSSAADLHCPAYHNPADYMMEVANGEHGHQVPAVLAQACSKNLPLHSDDKNIAQFYQEIDSQKSDKVATRFADDKGQGPIFSASAWSQFFILWSRTFKCTMRDPVQVKVRLFGHLMMAVLTGLLYRNIGENAADMFSISGFLLGCEFFLQFTALMPTVIAFPLENAVLEREYLNYWYSLKPYYLARTLVDVPFQLVFTVLFVGLSYFMTDNPAEASRFFMFLLMCSLVSLAAQSIGLFVGAAVPLKHGVILGPVICMPISLFTGFFITLSNIPSYFRWISYLSYMRYTFEGAMVAMFGHGRSRMACPQDYCHFSNPVKTLEQFDMKDVNFWVNVGAAMLCILVIRLAAYLTLKVNLARKQ